MITLPTWCWVILPSLTAAYLSEDLLFLKEYILFRDSPTQHYEIISCEHSKDAKLIKMLSMTLTRFVTIHVAERVLEPVPYELTTFVLNLWCPNWMETLQQGKKLNLFRKPFKWVLLDNNGDVSGNVNRNLSSNEVWDFLYSLPLLVDSDFHVVSKGETSKVSVISPYKISENGHLIKESLIEWIPPDQFVVFNTKEVASRRWNLRGFVMPATLVVTDPESIFHMEDLVDKHKDTTSKVTFNAIKLLEHILNVRMNYKIDDVWGIPLENGSWTGMVGDIQRGDVILGASPLFLSANRLEIVEYYATVTPTKVRFIFISPPLSHSSNIFAMPFASVVWICCLITFVVACVLLFLAINIEDCSGRTDNENREGSVKLRPRKITLGDIVLYNIGAICQQGTAAQTYEPAGRIITLFTYITYMFLYISYSASIVAILQSSDTSIQTLSDLLKSPMEVGADDVAYSQYYFKTADDPLRKKFYETKIYPIKKEPPHFMSPDMGIKKVRNGLFAYHVETSVGYQLIQKTFTEEEKCGLQELKMSFLRVGDPWLVMKKRNPYAELIRIGMKRVIETGFKTRLVRRYYTKKPHCGLKSSRFLTVGIIDCHHAFLFLTYGIAVSAFVFIVENIIKKFFPKFNLPSLSRKGR